MSFSAFNVGRQMIKQTGNVLPQQSLGSRPVSGGSFTPNTLEAAFVLRSNLDYQFETGFLDKHRAQMQNRLNEVSKKLEEAYKDLLNVSMSQQIGEAADDNLRADVRLDGLDGTNSATKISGVLGETAFEDLGVDPNTQQDLDYTLGTSNSGSNIWRAPDKTTDQLSATGIYGDDGNTGYGRQIGSTEVQFRTLTERTTAAGNIAGNMDITLRVEDDPPEPQDIDGNLDLLNTVTSAILGGPPDPAYYNQKVEQYSAGYSTGGFWSAVNYLYNFSPREIKYSYAVGYSVNSDEAGNDDYLINGELVNARDIPNTTYNADGSVNSTDPQGYLKKDNRVKWSSNNPIEGYQSERSGTSSNYPTIINRKNVWIDESSTGSVAWDLVSGTDAASGQVNIVEGLIFQSGTYTYDGTFVNETGGIGTNVAGTQNVGGKIVQTQAQNAASGLVDLTSSNIELGSTFRHDVDMTEDDTEDDVTPGTASSEFEIHDRAAIRSSLFFNHYEVETRTVEFNNKANVDLREITIGPTANDIRDDAAGQLYVKGGIERSKSIDASKNYDLIAEDPINAPDTKEISRTAGNVSKSFKGEFLHSLHKIHSVNGQDVVGNENKQASPVMGDFEIGRYEGLQRSLQMNRNIVDYKAPTETEVDAANAVPTDWHQAEMLTTATQNPQDPDDGAIWFPHVDDTLYSAKDDLGYGRASAPRQLIQARNSFTLKEDEFLDLLPAASWVTDATGTTRPTYQRKDIAVDIDLTGIHYKPVATSPFPANPTDEDFASVPKIFINGREYTALPINVTPQVAPDVANVTYRVVLSSSDPANASFLQGGENTIVVQASDGKHSSAGGVDNFAEGIRVTTTAAADYATAVAVPSGNPGTNVALGVPAAADFAEVSSLLNSKVITGYSVVDGVSPEVQYASTLSRPGAIKALSRWQTRIVPLTTERDTINNKLVQLASTQESTGSSNKSTNAFVEMIVNMLNERKYRDIFKLGLVSNLNKLALNGQAQLPSGSSMQGSVSMFYDIQQQAMVLTQDKLIAQSKAAT